MTNQDYLQLLKFAVLNSDEMKKHFYHQIPHFELRNSDFTKIQNIIHQKLNGAYLSESTIENIFRNNLYEVPLNPEKRITTTLNTLSQFAGFKTFDLFKEYFDSTVAVRFYLPKILIETNYYEFPTKLIDSQEFLKHLSYLDIFVFNDTIYALATIIFENDYLQDPDGSKYYSQNSFVISFNKTSVRVLSYSNPKYIWHGAVCVSDDMLYVFTQYKVPKGYGFSGAVHVISLNEFNSYKYCVPIFDTDNMGIKPFFKDGKVHNFRANNYHYCINDHVGEKINPQVYDEIYQKELTFHSNKILDNLSGKLHSMSKNGTIIIPKIIQYLS